MTGAVQPPHPKFNLLKLIISLGLLILILAGLTLLPVKDYLFSLLEWTRNLGMWGPLIIILFYILASVIFFPGWILTVGAGFLFGVVWGTATISIGSTLGAAAAFLAGRTLARNWISKKVSPNPKFAALDEAVEQHGFKLVLLLRLSPIFPFNLLNYALGLTQVRFWHYALASWIGMLPGTLMYVYLGTAARSLTEIATGGLKEGKVQQISFWIGLGATVMVAILVTRIAQKSLKSAAGRVGGNNG
ncbi:TVP38/TMEM64 family protein [bacterium]|nr:TVP38/TMEM64 family protein [bacterium]